MPLTDQAWLEFRLRQGTREPGAFRIGDGGGAAVLTGVCLADDLDTILREGMETAIPDNSTGALARTLPVAHPAFPWLYLKNVDNVVGVSFVEKIDADPDGQLDAPVMPYYANYTEYEVTATFEPRPYAVLSDDTIEQYSLTYYGPDDTGTGGGETLNGYYEWYRYTEWLRMPAAEYLTADIGQFVFANPGGAGDTTGPSDRTSAGKGQTRFLVPSSTWKVNWYRVPYSYVLSTNSYFDGYMGHVNQFEWEGFDPGEALMQAINVTRVYPPPFPEFDEYEGRSVVSQAKLCDIEFVIHAVERTIATPVTPLNRSHIAGGHNLVAFAPNGKYYYAENFRANTTAAGQGKPIYPSVPFDIFFQNPDAP